MPRSITFGMLGPVYGLSLRDSSLIILFFTLLATIAPAFLSILGPKTGMRQMIQARFSFGYVFRLESRGVADMLQTLAWLHPSRTKPRDTGRFLRDHQRSQWTMPFSSYRRTHDGCCWHRDRRVASSLDLLLWLQRPAHV